MLRCKVCNTTGCTLQIGSCGHGFHTRCIFRWPIVSCQYCASYPNPPLYLIRPPELATTSTTAMAQPRNNSTARSGKWLPGESEYIKILLAIYMRGMLPLHRGRSVRGFLSQVINCNPMRVSKKVTVPMRDDTMKEKNYQEFIQLQRKCSRFEESFYWSFCHKQKSAIQNNAALQHLKNCAQSAWITEFQWYAKSINQSYIIISTPLTAMPFNLNRSDIMAYQLVDNSIASSTILVPSTLTHRKRAAESVVLQEHREKRAKTTQQKPIRKPTLFEVIEKLNEAGLVDTDELTVNSGTSQLCSGLSDAENFFQKCGSDKLCSTDEIKSDLRFHENRSSEVKNSAFCNRVALIDTDLTDTWASFEPTMNCCSDLFVDMK